MDEEDVLVLWIVEELKVAELEDVTDDEKLELEDEVWPATFPCTPDRVSEGSTPHALARPAFQASVEASVFCMTEPQRSVPIIEPGYPHLDLHF